MKQINLENFEQVEVKETQELIFELREYQKMIKELQTREKVIKSNLIERLEKNQNKYIDEMYIAELKEIKSKRLDTKEFEKYCIKNDLEINYFKKETISKRLDIKLNKESKFN